MTWFLQQINTQGRKRDGGGPYTHRDLKELPTDCSVRFPLDPDTDKLFTHTHTRILAHLTVTEYLGTKIRVFKKELLPFKNIY